MSFTASPASRSALAVPPVEISSTPAAASVWAKVTRPVLSETESSARRIFSIDGVYNLRAGIGVNGQNRRTINPNHLKIGAPKKTTCQRGQLATVYSPDSGCRQLPPVAPQISQD